MVDKPINFYSRETTNLTDYWHGAGTINNDYATSSNPTEADVFQACYDCTITTIYVAVKTAPGVGKSRTFTLRKNGADTDVTATISDTATSANGTGSATFAASLFDTISIKEVAVNIPAECPYAVSFLATTSTDRQINVCGVRIAGLAVGNVGFSSPMYNNYFSFGGGGDTDFNLRYRTMLMSAAGTCRDFRVKIETAPGPTSGYKWWFGWYTYNTAKVQQVGNAFIFGIQQAQTEGDSGASTVSIAQGDTFNLSLAGNSGLEATTKEYHTIEFVPTTAGNRVYEVEGKLLSDDAGDTLFGAAVRVSDVNATFYKEATYTEPFNVMPVAGTISNLCVQTIVAPGAGETVVVTLRKNFVNTALTVTVSSTDIYGSNTGTDISVAAGDKISLSVVSSASADKTAKVGWTFNSGYSNTTPIFWSNWGYNSPTESPAATNIPLDFHSRTKDAADVPINFYSRTV